MDNYLTSDLIIYNVLKNSNDEFLKNFNILFPKEDFIVQESNSILIANVDMEYKTQTMGSNHYKALTEVFIKTRQNDYLKASKILKTGINRIRNLIGKDEELKKRKIIFRNNTADYGNNFTLRGRHLLIQTNEYEILDENEDYRNCLNLNYKEYKENKNV